jgi:hypothetical protein
MRYQQLISRVICRDWNFTKTTEFPDFAAIRAA